MVDAGDGVASVRISVQYFDNVISMTIGGITTQFPLYYSVAGESRSKEIISALKEAVNML